MTMINDLPMDLVQEILSRVPLKSMRSVRFTCKSWNNLLKSKSFAKMHISRSALEGECQMILMKDYNIHLVSVFLNDVSTKFLGKLTCLEEQVKISQVFQCDGLLLCILKDDDTKVVVWNPYLGQTRWIELRYRHHRVNGIDRSGYALGYDDRSHKFLRFIDEFYVNVGRFSWYEIYDFDTGLWTTLDVNPYCCIWYHREGLSLKGNTYWLAGQINSKNKVNIICFDFTSERFGPLLRLPFDLRIDDYVKLYCVKEEKLVVLHGNNEVNPHHYEIWITTKIDAENVSWSKFLTLKTTPSVQHPISLGNLFIDEEKKVVMSFYKKIGTSDQYTLSILGEAGYYKRLDLGEGSKKGCWAGVRSFVPSLAQIQKSAGGERKQQSDLEKRRYDENMSRLVALHDISQFYTCMR